MSECKLEDAFSPPIPNHDIITSIAQHLTFRGMYLRHIPISFEYVTEGKFINLFLIIDTADQNLNFKLSLFHSAAILKNWEASQRAVRMRFPRQDLVMRREQTY